MIAAFALLMDAKPYSKITISDICEKAGIARPTFYRNYNDKDDIVFECFRKTLNIVAEKPPKEKARTGVLQ
jgi:AcrR family transcriptional regulator